jgi:hypothetical protein
MENEELKNRITSLSDDKLIELLKLRDSYQTEAVRIAVREAMSRQLIQSEDDLQSAKFQPDNGSSKTIFPYLNNETHFQKVFNSLIRILYLVAIIPVVFGALNLFEPDVRGGLVLLGLGLLWVGLSVRLHKQQHAQTPLVLMVLLLFGLVRAFFSLNDPSALQLTDLIVYGIAILLVTYVLVYLRVLLVRKKKMSTIRIKRYIDP